MASLRAHLCHPGEHGGLSFHPACPVCRGERLAGDLPTASLGSRRVQAGITAGVLALTSVAPTAAFATDGTPGTAPPDQILGEIEPGEDPAETWQEGEEAIEG